MLNRIREALDGRAKPDAPARASRTTSTPRPAVLAAPAAGPPAQRRARRTPINPPPFPPTRAAAAARTAVTVLQVARAALRPGVIDAGPRSPPASCRNDLMGDLTLLMNDGVPRPDLLVVAGNLTGRAARASSPTR